LSLEASERKHIKRSEFFYNYPHSTCDAQINLIVTVAKSNLQVSLRSQEVKTTFMTLYNTQTQNLKKGEN
jgi:hypothetical protein